MIFKTILRLGLSVLAFKSFGQNPIVQTNYTADPAPMVYNGKVYLYTSHDEDNSTWFTMNDWRLYTTEDMVNWTDHGAVLSYKDFSWAKMNAWAAQCIERDGKFYMYVPITDHQGKNGIGVAVSNSPYGPFIDPLGKPLIQNSNADIDPTVFIDDDGQAYLLWGNPECYYVKLNEDMISFNDEIKTFPNTIESFGKRLGEDNSKRPTTYEEGPWLYKRNGLYYLFFAAGPISEHLGYSTSNSPIGPWKYQGVVMPTEGKSFTNHPGVIDFKGKTYLFYHNGALPGGNGFNRSVCVDELKFNSDGTVIPMNMGQGVGDALVSINPYIKNEAEMIAWSQDVKSMKNDEVGVFITAKKNEAYTLVKNVDFRKDGASKFTARLGTTHNSSITLEIRIDSVDGELLGTVKVPMTGGNDRWALVSSNIEKVTGTHDLYFVFKGNVPNNIMYFDYWKFSN
ncbi:glycoside hydrolase family 43 protein [Aestuariibaculum suncheonense]|uniref:Family 43 glycosylhydrolase n=1 Tax=Aestuariibaculum suncheonense TaxID=1028745 RepID=A0A8J6QDK6_9FLAO|nr:glycoside hydrolase family 43 protein [Aestuariibaculum suncheonense]MBD0835113.1 family 43 glycosylhydrolase [Aestuariibaculum suncheonense]